VATKKTIVQKNASRLPEIGYVFKGASCIYENEGQPWEVVKRIYVKKHDTHTIKQLRIRLCA